MASKRPNGDVWMIVDADESSQHYGKKFKLDFSYIQSEEIKDLFKDYVWHNYRVGNKTIYSLYIANCSYFFRFNLFATENNIYSLTELDNCDIDNYISFLHTSISKTGKPLKYKSQKACLDLLKSFIGWCRLHEPEKVPEKEIFTGNEYPGGNRKVKIEFIPDNIVFQINEALKSEENPYIKYGIIILQTTGMRIGDLINLRIDCIKPHVISGYTIEWTQFKTRKNKYPLPARKECVNAVEKLLEYTSNLRKDADEDCKDILMIRRITQGNDKGKVAKLYPLLIYRWFEIFTREHNIMTSNGEYYNLTSHQFRRTLGTDMLSKGVDINVIRDVLGHKDAETTFKYYADIKDKERAEIYSNIGIIGNINQISVDSFDDALEFEWFKANKGKSACMCDGYCTKPVVDGRICDRLLKRQKCYTCSRYITTPEYLEAHKQHLANLEKQLEGGVIYGEHYAEHFIPTIEVLKVIIERLEGLQNGN